MSAPTLQGRMAVRSYCYGIFQAMLGKGLEVNGILFDSDSNARAAYSELAIKFQSDPSFTKRWKASGTIWVDMNLTLFEQILVATEEMCSLVFEWLETEQSNI